MLVAVNRGARCNLEIEAGDRVEDFGMEKSWLQVRGEMIGKILENWKREGKGK